MDQPDETVVFPPKVVAAPVLKLGFTHECLLCGSRFDDASGVAISADKRYPGLNAGQILSLIAEELRCPVCKSQMKKDAMDGMFQRKVRKWLKGQPMRPRQILVKKLQPR